MKSQNEIIKVMIEHFMEVKLSTLIENSELDPRKQCL